MSQYVIDFGTLNNIANAIREKGNTAATMTPLQMPDYIRSIQTGGGSGPCDKLHIPEERLVLSGSLDGRFQGGSWDWFIEEYGNHITTQYINNTSNMFVFSKLTEIPFDFNFNAGAPTGYMFNQCNNLTSIGDFYGWDPWGAGYMFDGCSMLRELPTMHNSNNFRNLHSAEGPEMRAMFSCCYSLRSIPEELIKEMYTACIWGSWDAFTSYAFNSCYALGEVRGLRVPYETSENIFEGTFTDCHRLRDITFATQPDGTPYTANLSYQYIDLSYGIGWVTDTSHITDYNSGLTWDDCAYWGDIREYENTWCDSPNCSRYNYASAVNTINTLPDCSAGFENIISFYGNSGMDTMEGAINQLTEEEIAVAAAKGWTVTFA